MECKQGMLIQSTNEGLLALVLQKDTYTYLQLQLFGLQTQPSLQEVTDSAAVAATFVVAVFGRPRCVAHTDKDSNATNMSFANGSCIRAVITACNTGNPRSLDSSLNCQ